MPSEYVLRGLHPLGWPPITSHTCTHTHIHTHVRTQAHIIIAVEKLSTHSWDSKSAGFLHYSPEPLTVLNREKGFGVSVAG